MLQNNRGGIYAALNALIGKKMTPEQRRIADRAVDEILALKEATRETD